MILLRSLPVLALAAAAVDVWFVRQALDHRPLDLGLYLEAVILWTGFGFLALLPASLLTRVTQRGVAGEHGAPWSYGALALAACMAFPVLAHRILDRYTSLGQDLSGLFAVGPWLEVAVLTLFLLAVAFVAPRPLARFSGVLVSGVVAVVAALVGGLAGAAAPPSASPATAPEGAPNLLLLVWDTTRSKSLSTYGYERETSPHLAAFAEQCQVYEEARSVSCFTLTSHLSMLTGVYPSHHGARLTRMRFDPSRTPSLARTLRDEGYRCGGFVGTGVLRASTGIVDGFDVYDDQVDPLVCDTAAWKLVHDVQSVAAKLVPALAGNGQPHWIEDFFRPAPEVLSRALAWIQEDDPRPWFCFINLYDVHWPYLPREESRRRFVEPYDGAIDGWLFRSDSYEKPDKGRLGSRLTERDDAHLVDLYDAEMWELDLEVHAFLEALDLERSRTGVVVTSDHGEAFGEAETYEHNDILEPQVRIPMLVHPPRDGSSPAVPPARHAGKVSNLDAGPTLLAMAGVATEQLESMTGRDLLAGPIEPERVVLVEDRDKLDQANTSYAIYEGTWKFERAGVGPEAQLQLFDLSSDPVGEQDVSAEHPELTRRLALRLEEERARWGGDQEEWDAAEGVGGGLAALGYTGEVEEDELEPGPTPQQDRPGVDPEDD